MHCFGKSRMQSIMPRQPNFWYLMRATCASYIPQIISKCAAVTVNLLFCAL